jgi:uncharacterized membrane protein YoaK (UPF0700 family)
VSGGRLHRLLAPPGDRHGPLVEMMVLLTLLTGVVDAASYLALGHVFVANMTGNVVFLGFALAGARGLSVASSLVALGAFLVGARAGGAIAAHLAAHRGRLLRASTGAQASLIAAALVLALAASSPLPAGLRYAITALLAIAMGTQNSAVQHIAVPELTTTVLTKTITSLVSDPGGARHLQARRVTAVGSMLIGALAGGLLALEASVGAALALALALASTVALLAHLRSGSDAPWTRP